MDNIIAFWNEMQVRECALLEARKDPDMTVFNDLVHEINGHLVGQGFSIGDKLRKFPIRGFYLKKLQKQREANPRFLYKISQYESKKYGDLYACYASVKNPIPDASKMLSKCFFIAEVKGELKIVGEYTFNEERRTWKHSGGDREIVRSKLGAPVQIERLLSPTIDRLSIEEFNKER